MIEIVQPGDEVVFLVTPISTLFGASFSTILSHQKVLGVIGVIGSQYAKSIMNLSEPGNGWHWLNSWDDFTVR